MTTVYQFDSHFGLTPEIFGFPLSTVTFTWIYSSIPRRLAFKLNIFWSPWVYGNEYFSEGEENGMRPYLDLGRNYWVFFLLLVDCSISATWNRVDRGESKKAIKDKTTNMFTKNITILI